MKTEKKKKPSDYPQISFRVKAKDKELTLKEIEEVTELLNRRRSPDSKVIRGNFVAVVALMRGLADLRKR